jgi:hypothetical protein
LTLDAFPLLLVPFEVAFQAHMAAWRLDGKPQTARRFTCSRRVTGARRASPIRAGRASAPDDCPPPSGEVVRTASRHEPQSAVAAAEQAD